MIPIVFSTDHNYVMQTGVCIYSLLHSADKCHYSIFVIIDENVTCLDKRQLESQVSQFNGHSIDFVNINNQFNGWYEVRGISKAAYYRLLIPWLLPDYDKIIYSDVDVIFRLSLQQIYNVDLNDNYLAAVRGAYFRYSKEPAEYAKSIGLSPENYFNSGFLLINAKKQREDNLKDEILKYSTSRLTYQDQDIINLICKGNIIPIEQKYCITPAFYTQYLVKNPDIYNFYGTREEVEDFLKGKNCILHYSGAKPWNLFVFGFVDWWETYRASNFYNPYYELSKYESIMNPTPSLRGILMSLKKYFKHLIRR